ncbi:hypothetical protein ALC60_07990, partial [Trachymyrmex zeteki]
LELITFPRIEVVSLVFGTVASRRRGNAGIARFRRGEPGKVWQGRPGLGRGDKKHQTKPPAFTESAGPAAPSLERVHVASFLQNFLWNVVLILKQSALSLARKYLASAGIAVDNIAGSYDETKGTRTNCG